MEQGRYKIVKRREKTEKGRYKIGKRRERRRRREDIPYPPSSRKYICASEKIKILKATRLFLG
jgi:hypothetical protein